MDTEILIVGAGLCGLHAATQLQAAGRSVLVLEKSRGLGGRAATRRWNNRPVDHGAQFFTAKNPEFVAQVARWLESGVCHEWTRGLHRFSAGQLHEPTDHSHPRYACRAGMAALGRALGGPLGEIVQRESKVSRLAVVDGQWQATLEDGRLVRSRSVLLTPPPAQSRAGRLTLVRTDDIHSSARAKQSPPRRISADGGSRTQPPPLMALSRVGSLFFADGTPLARHPSSR